MNCRAKFFRDRGIDPDRVCNVLEVPLTQINELEPDSILPQHRDTYRVTPQNRYWTNGYPYEVKLRLSKALQARYHILKQGEKLVITGS